jgi:hypothetical protein
MRVGANIVSLTARNIVSRPPATSSFPPRHNIVIPAAPQHRHSRRATTSSFPRKRESIGF